MKILVCGGRTYTNKDRVFEILDRLAAHTKPTLLISGCAMGADTLGSLWAIKNDVKVASYPANWEKYRRNAGPIRNMEMLQACPDLVIAFPGGRGTAHMVHIAKAAWVPTCEVDVDPGILLFTQTKQDTLFGSEQTISTTPDWSRVLGGLQ